MSRVLLRDYFGKFFSSLEDVFGSLKTSRMSDMLYCLVIVLLGGRFLMN